MRKEIDGLALSTATRKQQKENMIDDRLMSGRN
jgi:hypothetical protein